MQDTITRRLAAFADGTDRQALRGILEAIGDRLSCAATATAGLVIKTGGSALAKTGTGVFQAVVKGKSITIAASTDMPALTDLDIGAGAYNVICFFVDEAATVTAVMGTEGATEAEVVFPQFPVGKALVGYLVITYASAFVGGTTPLDTATTKYVSPVGAFDPSILV